MAAPGIKWVKYSLDTAGTGIVASTITSNTVDYDAVQAGNYSNIMCVRPQFTDTSTSQSIGKVRFWWYGIKGTNSTQVNLPNKGWVMKYYVTDCSTLVTSTALTTADQTQKKTNLVKALNAFANSTIKNAVTVGKTFTATFTSGTQAYYKSTWQAASDTTYISMQPVPFFASQFGTASVQATTFANSQHYATSSWIQTVFGASVTNNDGSALQYCVGGVLNASSCNLVASVSADTDFPFIFLSIKPPTDADAGTWSGFSCRLSFIWPYTTTTTA